jgi:hypothetical protein
VYEARQDGAQVAAAVEAVLHFGEISMSVFGEFDCVIWARHRRLQVAQDSVDGPVFFHLDAAPSAAGDSPVMGHAIPLATVKQLKPSDTTVAGRTIDVDMNSLSDSL